jgi:hypothetical protein
LNAALRPRHLGAEVIDMPLFNNMGSDEIDDLFVANLIEGPTVEDHVRSKSSTAINLVLG